MTVPFLVVAQAAVQKGPVLIAVEADQVRVGGPRFI